MLILSHWFLLWLEVVLSWWTDFLFDIVFGIFKWWSHWGLCRFCRSEKSDFSSCSLSMMQLTFVHQTIIENHYHQLVLEMPLICLQQLALGLLIHILVRVRLCLGFGLPTVVRFQSSIARTDHLKPSFQVSKRVLKTEKSTISKLLWSSISKFFGFKSLWQIRTLYECVLLQNLLSHKTWKLNLLKVSYFSTDIVAI